MRIKNVVQESVGQQKLLLRITEDLCRYPSGEGARKKKKKKKGAHKLAEKNGVGVKQYPFLISLWGRRQQREARVQYDCAFSTV